MSQEPPRPPEAGLILPFSVAEPIASGELGTAGAEEQPQPQPAPTPTVIAESFEVGAIRRGPNGEAPVLILRLNGPEGTPLALALPIGGYESAVKVARDLLSGARRLWTFESRPYEKL